MTVSERCPTAKVVPHLPKKLREKLPLNSNISFGFNNSYNNRVETRYGFNGLALPNAKGHSRDYSLVLNTLNDRLTFRTLHLLLERPGTGPRHAYRLLVTCGCGGYLIYSR